MRFKYHMYGNPNMGTFRVLTSSNGQAFTGGYLDKSGNQGDEWFDAAITFTSAIDLRVSINIFSINVFSINARNDLVNIFVFLYLSLYSYRKI